MKAVWGLLIGKQIIAIQIEGKRVFFHTGWFTKLDQYDTMSSCSLCKLTSSKELKPVFCREYMMDTSAESVYATQSTHILQHEYR